MWSIMLAVPSPEEWMIKKSWFGGKAQVVGICR